MKAFFHDIRLYFLLSFVIFYSCHKEKDLDNHEYLLNYELVRTNSPEQNKSGLLFASLLFPEFDSLVDYSRYGSAIYRVEYKTTFMSDQIIASGLVTFPDEDTLFPVVSFQNGTNTCHSNAPSENASGQLYATVSMMAGNGYIIAIPDYVGFGTSQQYLHPYLHKESTISAIRDFIMAVKELAEEPEIKARHNGNLYLMGYSQGGWATLTLLSDFEANPVTGCNLIAAAGGAGAYDLTEMANYMFQLEKYQTSYFLPYFIESRRRNNILQENLLNYFQEPYASKIPEVFNGDLCNSAVNAEFTPIVRDLVSEDIYNNFSTSENFRSLRNELQTNSIDAWSLKTPLHLFHSMGDQTIPYQQSQSLYHKFTENYNISEDLLSMKLLNDTLDHDEAVIQWGIDALVWFRWLK